MVEEEYVLTTCTSCFNDRYPLNIRHKALIFPSIGIGELIHWAFPILAVHWQDWI